MATISTQKSRGKNAFQFFANFPRKFFNVSFDKISLRIKRIIRKKNQPNSGPTVLNCCKLLFICIIQIIQTQVPNYNSTKLDHSHIILILITSYCLLIRLIDLFRRHIYLKCLIPMRSYGSKMGQLIDKFNKQYYYSIVVSISRWNHQEKKMM